MSSMRRKDKEIKDKVVNEEILLQNLVGRLGTSVDGIPYVVPMNFAYVKDKIYLHSHQDGKKVIEIKKNPKVCFEVDSGEMIEGDAPCDYSWRYHSVIVQGTARIVTDPAEKLATLKIISNKYAFGKGDQITAETIEKNTALIAIIIDVESMTGKKSSV